LISKIKVPIQNSDLGFLLNTTPERFLPIKYFFMNKDIESYYNTHEEEEEK